MVPYLELCAPLTKPQDEAIVNELPTLEILARLLETLLEYDLTAIEKERILERSQHAALTDGSRVLLNRRGWDQCIAKEESRCKRYGSPVCVFIVDLDELKKKQ